MIGSIKRLKTYLDMQVTDLTVEELKLLIQETVADTIQAILVDPDQGKQVKSEFAAKLRQSLAETQAGEKGKSAHAVMQEIGIDWDEL